MPLLVYHVERFLVLSIYHAGHANIAIQLAPDMNGGGIAGIIAVTLMAFDNADILPARRFTFVVIMSTLLPVSINTRYADSNNAPRLLRWLR